MIERTEYMSILKRWKDKRIVKVITGIRRCGKSSLLKMFQEYLVTNGVAPSQVQAINLEDIDNEPFLDYHTLYGMPLSAQLFLQHHQADSLYLNIASPHSA